MPSIISRAIMAGLAATVYAGKTQSVASWGDNPSNLPAMLVYTPDKLAEKPAVIVGLHPCGGTGSRYQSMTGLDRYADQLGFVVLYPTSKAQNGMNCWDCNTVKSLTRDGGGDSQGVVGMVKWALETYKGDPAKVFAVGGSSGAMFTNVLAGTYPDVFAAGASYSGVPAGCWAGAPISTPTSSDLSCPLGQKASTYSAQQWGDIGRGLYPGYNGTRTRMLVVHGTGDAAVVISLLKAQLDQWSNIMELTFAGNTTNDPIRNWKKICYGDCTKLVGYEVQGGGHIPAFQGDSTLKFFGLL